MLSYGIKFFFILISSIIYGFTLFPVCWEISVLSMANLQRPPHSPVIIIEGH